MHDIPIRYHFLIFFECWLVGPLRWPTSYPILRLKADTSTGVSNSGQNLKPGFGKLRKKTGKPHFFGFWNECDFER